MSLLRELGVDWYTTKASLAGQSPELSRAIILPFVAEIADAAHLSSQANTIGSNIRVRPKLDIELGEIKTKIVVASKPKVRPPVVSSEPIVSFNLLVATSSNYAFVCDVKTCPLNAIWERSVKSFLDEISFSMGQSVNSRISLNYFSWPLLDNIHTNLGEVQLSQLLNGFLQQRIAIDKKAIILFGENAQRYVKPFISNADIKSVNSIGLGKLFSSPNLKAELWEKLQLIN
jgi:hypothetical protein